MKFQTKYKIVLLKKYFDIGFGTTSYLKYGVAAIGVERAVNSGYQDLLWIGGIYGIFCFFFGWWYVKSKFFTAEQEVSNTFNLFVKEMREKVVNVNKRYI